MGGRTRRFNDGENVWVVVDAIDLWGNIFRGITSGFRWAPGTSIILTPVLQFYGYQWGGEVWGVNYTMTISNKYHRAFTGSAAGHFRIRYPWESPVASPKAAISLITNDQAEFERFYFANQDELNNSSPLRN